MLDGEFQTMRVILSKFNHSSPPLIFVYQEDAWFKTAPYLNWCMVWSNIGTLNETHPYLKITNDWIDLTEDAFKKIRELLFCKYAYIGKEHRNWPFPPWVFLHIATQKYYKMVQVELIRLYDLQQEIRQLGLFDIRKRIQLSISVSILLLEIPIIINNASKAHQNAGVFSGLLETILGSTIQILEVGERYTASGWWPWVGGWNL